MSQVKDLTPIALKKMLDGADDFTLIDVREEHELEICKIGGTHIPLGQVADKVQDLSLDKPIVFYCRSGGRSFDAATYYAQETDHSEVYNLKGGILLWADQVDKTITKY